MAKPTYGCGICGAFGHRRADCPARKLNEEQTIRAVLAGRATPDEVREVYRTMSRTAPAGAVKC